MSIKNFSKTEIEKLSKDLKVDAVIFGEITDDFDSGQLQIRVSAESFDERILLQESILFPRGLRQNLQPRQDSMRALVKKFVPHPQPLPETPPPMKPLEVLPSTEMDQFVFALKSCKFSGKNLICSFLITNKGEDRDMGIVKEGTRIIDANGNEYIAKFVSIGARGPGAKIVSGVPVKLSIDFGAVNMELKKIVLCEIQFYLHGVVGNSQFPQFRNFFVEK